MDSSVNGWLLLIRWRRDAGSSTAAWSPPLPAHTSCTTPETDRKVRTKVNSMDFESMGLCKQGSSYRIFMICVCTFVIICTVDCMHCTVRWLNCIRCLIVIIPSERNVFKKRSSHRKKEVEHRIKLFYLIILLFEGILHLNHAHTKINFYFRNLYIF